MSRIELKEMVDYIGNILKHKPGYTYEQGKKIFAKYASDISFEELYKQLQTIDGLSGTLFSMVFANPQSAVLQIYYIRLARDLSNELGNLFEDYLKKVGTETELERGNIKIKMPGSKLYAEANIDLYGSRDEKIIDFDIGYKTDDKIVEQFLRKTDLDIPYINTIKSTNKAVKSQVIEAKHFIESKTIKFGYLGLLLMNLPNFSNLFTIM